MIYFLDNIKQGYGKFMDILNLFGKFFCKPFGNYTENIYHQVFNIYSNMFMMDL